MGPSYTGSKPTLLAILYTTRLNLSSGGGNVQAHMTVLGEKIALFAGFPYREIVKVGVE